MFAGEFIEEWSVPIYSGKYAGHMVKFRRKDGDVLLAAGIWEEWVDKKTGEVRPTFSILTDEPVAFINKIGDDRFGMNAWETINFDGLSIACIF